MKVKQILNKWVFKNIGYKILALVFAFVLWLAIMNIQDPTKSRTITNIQVTKLNEELLTGGDYAYTVKSGDTATITIEGRKSIVDSLRATDFVAVADFEELSITNAIPITVSLTPENSSYASYLTITQRTNSMLIQLETITSRLIDVSLNYVGMEKENVVIDDAVINPAQIKVTAPVSVLDSLDRIEATVNYADIDEGVSLRAAPVIYNTGGGVVTPEDDIEIDTEEVVVDFDVKHTKTVPVNINVMGTPAEGYEYTNTTYSFSNVTLKGSSEVLKGISRISLPSSLLDITGESRDVSINVNMNEYAPYGTVVYDNNVNMVITAHIKEMPTTTTSAATTPAETNENGETVQSAAGGTINKSNANSTEETAAETTEPTTTSKDN